MSLEMTLQATRRRKLDDKYRPLPDDGLHRYPASVQLDDPPGQRKPQPEARYGIPFVRPVEGLKGFLHTSSILLKTGVLIVIAKEYLPVDDADYEDDPSVGAKISSAAIRKAMQGIFDRKGGCFHAHLHDHDGPTGPSRTGQKGLPPVAESFSNISGEQSKGFLILSRDSFYAAVKMRGVKGFLSPSCISVVGHSMLFTHPNAKRARGYAVNDRQSFLGADSPFLFENVKVCIIGYGGGGSHIGQQFAHIGVNNINVYDGDRVESTNMNRLIGAWFQDLKEKMYKTDIAKRTIQKIFPGAAVRTVKSRWQEQPEYLQESDIVIGVSTPIPTDNSWRPSAGGT